MKLVIDRSKWLRGEGSYNSYLLRATDKKQCCIGFLCEALGVPKDDLVAIKGSQRLIQHNLPAWLMTPNDDLFCSKKSDLFKAYALNDMYAGEPGYIDEANRELEITTLFARHGIEVEFTN